MDIIKKEGVFRLYDKQSTVILTDEKQLNRIIEDPSKPLFDDEERGFSGESTGLYEKSTSLVSLCEEAQKQHCDRMEVSYDFFFGGSTRTNYPSDETTIKAFKVVRDVAKEHGMSFGASILSPLDVGGGYAKDHDETGFSYQFLETELKANGDYCANMVCQKQWYNNKGPISLKLEKVMAFAFREERIEKTSLFYVNPDEILDISATAKADVEDDKTVITSSGYGSCPMTISGHFEDASRDRVLCVAVYRTPELDYFADSAPAFMKELLDKHHEAGIDYGGFYSDEMHIQFDWDLENHFGETEINTRYLTPNLMKKYASLYGEQYLDFPKYLVYMAYHQHDFLEGELGKENAQHVFGKTPEDVYQTWLFRNRYFELLQRTVVDLCNNAKAYAEELFGGPIMTRAHATWQESPTCDHYYKKANAIGGFNLADKLDEKYRNITSKSPVEDRAALEKAKMEKAKEMGISRYEYTPYYDWSASIRENTSACYDYFKWNEFLTGSGTDHPEGGNLDRNYFGQALASSFGSLNPFRTAYCAGWGMPKTVQKYFDSLGAAFGNQYSNQDFNFVEGLEHRSSDVLALYPIELNNVEERFGSWMVQYGYCNYITEEKLLEYASVTDHGTLLVNGREYRTLVALFEPFFTEKSMAILKEFVAKGGKVLWMSIYPVLSHSGKSVLEDFCKLFGVEKFEEASFAKKCPGEKVVFSGAFQDIAPMTITNDYLVDYVYPFVPADGEVVATIGGAPAAVCKRYPGGGVALYAGFRVRDDQSCSLGEDVDTLFQMLLHIDAYRPGSLEVRSRRTGEKLLMNRFPNGAVSAAPHYRTIQEGWGGSFFREEEFDRLVMEGRELPSNVISLDEEIEGHKVAYQGAEFLAYRLDDNGKLNGFTGKESDGITIDGKKWVLADQKVNINFALVSKEFLSDNVSCLYICTCYTEGATLTLPVCGCKAPKVEVCGDKIFTTVDSVPHEYSDGTVTYQVTPELVGKQVAIIY